MNVTVLDLQPAWGIAQAYPPDSDFEELDPGGEPLVIPLKASLPEGYESGVDTLKVLAAVKPTSFRQLTLPRLDQPIRTMPLASGQSGNREGSPGATAGRRECGSAAESRRLRRHLARQGVGLRQGAGSHRGEAEVNELRQEPRTSPAAHPIAPDHQVVPKRRRFSGRSDMVGPVNQAPEKMGPTCRRNVPIGVQFRNPDRWPASERLGSSYDKRESMHPTSNRRDAEVCLRGDEG